MPGSFLLKLLSTPDLRAAMEYFFSLSLKRYVMTMKGSRGRETPQNKQGPVNTPRPEIRDNLDSRERKDVNYKDRTNKAGKKANSRDKDKHGA